MVVGQMLVMVGQFLVAVMAASVFFERNRRAHAEINNEDGLFEELQHLIETREFTAAYMHAFRTGTPISRVVAAGLAKFNSGKEPVFAAMRHAIDDEQARWRDSMFRLTVCGALASGFGLIGVLVSVPRAVSSVGASTALLPAGLIVALSIGISLMVNAGHGALTQKMSRSQEWLEVTAAGMLNNAARVAVLSTRISSASLPEPRTAVVRGRS